MAKQKSLKDRQKEAEQIVEAIDQQLLKAKKGVKDCLTELSKASDAKSDFNKLTPQINRTSKSVNAALLKIRDDRDKLKRLLTTVNNFYEKKFIPLQEKINDPASGLKAKITEGRDLERDMKRVRLNNQKQLDLIRRLANDFNKKVNELNDIERSLRRINSKIEDYDKSITDRSLKIEQDLQKVEAASKNILETEKSIVEISVKIKNLHEDSEDIFNQLVQWRDEANNILKKIRDIYQIAMGSGLGGEFDKRRSSLETDLKLWKKWLLWTTVLLLLMVIALFFLQLAIVDYIITDLKFDANFYVRFLITSPVIYYLIFVTGQYNRTKSLLERYSFKTALALSIEAHINLLIGTTEFQDKEQLNKIIDFILDGFSKIYDYPYQEKKIKESKKTSEVLLNELKSLKNIVTENLGSS